MGTVTSAVGTVVTHTVSESDGDKVSAVGEDITEE
jgi:hypothetical protein